MDPLLVQGLEITLIGVSVVFVFLVLLVGVVRAMSLSIAALGLDAAPAAMQGQAPAIAEPGRAPAAPGTVDERTLTVIREAIRQHRARP